jgi:hypothetical protein
VLLSSLPLLQQKSWFTDVGGEDYYTTDNVVGLDWDEWEHDHVAEPKLKTSTSSQGPHTSDERGRNAGRRVILVTWMISMVTRKRWVRFDLRLPYADQGYVDDDADVMGKVGNFFGGKKTKVAPPKVEAKEEPKKQNKWPWEK